MKNVYLENLLGEVTVQDIVTAQFPGTDLHKALCMFKILGLTHVKDQFFYEDANV